MKKHFYTSSQVIIKGNFGQKNCQFFTTLRWKKKEGKTEPSTPSTRCYHKTCDKKRHNDSKIRHSIKSTFLFTKQIAIYLSKHLTATFNTKLVPMDTTGVRRQNINKSYYLQ